MSFADQENEIDALLKQLKLLKRNIAIAETEVDDAYSKIGNASLYDEYIFTKYQIINIIDDYKDRIDQLNNNMIDLSNRTQTKRQQEYRILCSNLDLMERALTEDL